MYIPYCKRLADIRDIREKVHEAGVSLRSLCETVDSLASVSNPAYDCCGNPDNLITRCMRRTFAQALTPRVITSPGTPGHCLSTGALCNPT